MPEPEVIQSRHNTIIKRVRSLQRPAIRRQERAFVIEGIRAIDDALQMGAAIDVLLVSDALSLDRLPDRLLNRQYRLVSDRLLRDLSDTVEPQGVLAIAPHPAPPSGPAVPSLALFVDRLSDPGNLGTLLRSSAGAGVTEALLSPETVDPYNPKVVRAAMGAHFRIPVRRLEPKGAMDFRDGMRPILADAAGDIPYDEVDMTGPTLIVVGSEAHGLSPAAVWPDAMRVSIPLALRTESLNAAVAGSVLLFEAVRQRKCSIRTKAWRKH
jgi:RNA methyltransferase, TrmH family